MSSAAQSTRLARFWPNRACGLHVRNLCLYFLEQAKTAFQQHLLIVTTPSTARQYMQYNRLWMIALMSAFSRALLARS